jgi:hypothetical protein
VGEKVSQNHLALHKLSSRAADEILLVLSSLNIVRNTTNSVVFPPSADHFPTGKKSNPK